MKNFKYSPETDDFDLTVTPEELDTIEAWLQEARRGITDRLKYGHQTIPVEDNLLKLGHTLDQMRELQEWRKGVHVE